MSKKRIIMLVLGFLLLGYFDDGIIPGSVSNPILFRIIIDSIGLILLIGSNYIDNNRRFDKILLGLEVLVAIGYLLCKYLYLNTHNVFILAVGVIVLIGLSIYEMMILKK